MKIKQQIESVYITDNHTFILIGNYINNQSLSALPEEGVSPDRELTLTQGLIHLLLTTQYMIENNIKVKEDMLSLHNIFMSDSSKDFVYEPLIELEKFEVIQEGQQKIDLTIVMNQISQHFDRKLTTSNQQKLFIQGYTGDRALLNAFKYVYQHQNDIAQFLIKMREVEQHLMNEALDKATAIEDENKEVGDDFIPGTITQVFSQMSFGGFSGKDFITHQNKMIEELQVFKYNLSQERVDKEENFLQITQVVKQNILRCTYEFSDAQTQERLRLLESGDRDKYNETIQTFVETMKWLSSEFKQRAIDMLDLTKHFEKTKIEEELQIDAVDKGTSYLTAVDQQILEVFKEDKYGLMSSAFMGSQISRQLIVSISKYVKLSFMKSMEQQNDDGDEAKVLEESVKLEDEIFLVFKVNRKQLSKAIIDFKMGDQFLL